MNTPEDVAALAALPDGTYFDGTYEWVKDGVHWIPLVAPESVPFTPDLARLKRAITRHLPLNAPTIPWNETTVEGLAAILRSIPADTPEDERQDEWSMWMAQRMFTLLGVTPKPAPDPEFGEWHDCSMPVPIPPVTDQMESAAAKARTRINAALIQNGFTGNGFPSSHVTLAVADVQAVIAFFEAALYSVSQPAPAAQDDEDIVRGIADVLAMSYGSHVYARKGGQDWRAAEDLVAAGYRPGGVAK